jgi:hypothetical protein
MNPLFTILARVLDAGMSPARGESVWPVLLMAGGVGTLAMLGVYRLFSNPVVLMRRRERMLARALEMVLFRHDLPASTAAVGRTLGANGRYLVSMLLPLIVTALVLSPLFVILAGWLEWRPLKVGESTVVEVSLKSDAPVLSTPIKVNLSPGLKQTSDMVRSLNRNALFFRIQAMTEGDATIGLETDDTVEQKSVAVGTAMRRVACERTVAGERASWFSPLESTLPPSSRIERISVQMPRREIDAGSWTVSWLTLEVLIIGGLGILLARVFRIALF